MTADVVTSHSVEPQPAKQTNKKQRVRLGILIGAVTLSAMFAGGWLLTAFVVFVLVQDFRELNTLFHLKGVKPSQLSVLLTGLGLILLAHYGKTHYFLSVITLGIIVGFIRLLFRQPLASINDISSTFMATFYVAFMPMHFILLRNLNGSETTPFWLEQGAFYVAFTCIVIAFSDIGAYFVGKRFGKTLLYPAVSPKKTREGALGGLFFGLAAGLLFLFLDGFDLTHALILSVLLVVVSQLGDLAESLLKRDAGVKDSGGLLLGHGGLLDRTDSYLFCGAVSYYYIHWVVLQQGLIPDLFPFLIY